MSEELPLEGYDPKLSLSAQLDCDMDRDFSITLMPMEPEDAKTGERGGVILFIAPGKDWGDQHLRKHGASHLASAKATFACAQYRDTMGYRANSLKYRGRKALENLELDLRTLHYGDAVVTEFVNAAKPYCT